jgi:hypothetical protein
MGAAASSAFHEIAPDRVEEWIARGHNRRHFFAHRAYRLPKCGPDGFLLAERMTGHDDPAAMREILLHADPATLDEFPAELFFDDDVIWHQQQFGLPGHVATASLVLDRDTVWTTVHVSDLVQRISRRRELKTRVEKRFKGWVHMLLNAVLADALERGARRVRTPTAALALRHTAEARSPQPALYERIYDQTLRSLYPVRQEGEWWVVDVAQARERVVVPHRRATERRSRRVVCICHDIERGLGHVGYDDVFSRRADERAGRDLEAMRRAEAALGVKATYCVVGALLEEVRAPLEADGHCLAFHSFDHRVEPDHQLLRCREVDYRLKGYRPPQSRLTPELSDRNLLRRNFEWLASSPASLGADAPEMRNGLVRLPIGYDDFPMWNAGVGYEDWEREALERIAAADFTAVDLHDCYAPWWLPQYPRFLEQVRELGELRTLDEVAAEMTLAAAD